MRKGTWEVERVGRGMDTCIETSRPCSGLGRVRITGNYRTNAAIFRFSRLICERSGKRTPFQEYNMTTNLDNLTKAEMLAMIKKLDEEKAKLEEEKASQKVPKISIGQKGTVCLYGFGKYPCAYYLSQWEYLFSRVDDVKAFIESHRDEILAKAEVKA
jgi:hypothetical protein